MSWLNETLHTMHVYCSYPHYIAFKQILGPDTCCLENQNGGQKITDFVAIPLQTLFKQMLSYGSVEVALSIQFQSGSTCCYQNYIIIITVFVL